MKLIGMMILLAFYAIYIGKMLSQRQRGIQTDQIARGKPHDRVFCIELVMKLATYAVVAVEGISIFIVTPALPQPVRFTGAAFGILGVIVFGAAVVEMRDSWRAGIAAQEQTELITSGIYQISRNPAFLGFDCVYFGLLLMFFNIPLLLISCFAALMLHLQILQEEEHLTAAFGRPYLDYKRRVRRYFGHACSKRAK